MEWSLSQEFLGGTKKKRKRKRNRSRSEFETEMKDDCKGHETYQTESHVRIFIQIQKYLFTSHDFFLPSVFIHSHHYEFIANIIFKDNQARECYYHKFIFYRQLFSGFFYAPEGHY